jgi:hypothetical protein
MLETASKISACEIAIVYSSKIIGFKLDNIAYAASCI